MLGYEALSRVDAGPETGPERWFRDAHRVGMGTDLEVHALRCVLAQLEAIPPERFVSVNLSASSLVAPGVLGVLDAVPAGRVVVELTEHDRGDEPRLAAALGRLREAGVPVAMDDVGAGYAGLRRMLRLRPDLIKLDRGLVGQVHRDCARRALIEAVVGFAASVGILLVAEGVECPDDASLPTILGVDAAQGYHYGGPRPSAWRVHETSRVAAGGGTGEELVG